MFLFSSKTLNLFESYNYFNVAFNKNYCINYQQLNSIIGIFFEFKIFLE